MILLSGALVGGCFDEPNPPTGSGDASTTSTGTVTGSPSSASGAATTGGSSTGSESGATSEGAEEWEPARRWILPIRGPGSSSGERVEQIVAFSPESVWITGSIGREESPANAFVAHLDASLGEAPTPEVFEFDDLGGFSQGAAMAVSGNDLLVVGAITPSGAAGFDRLVLRFDTTQMTFDAVALTPEPLAGPDQLLGVAATDSDVWLAGTLLDDEGSPAAWLGAYDADWLPRYESMIGVNPADAFDVVLDGSFIMVVGRQTSASGDTDAWVRRSRVNGTTEAYFQVFAMEGDQEFRAAALGPSGDLFAVGRTVVAGQASNAWVQRISSGSGAPGWSDTFDGGTGGDDVANAVAIGPAGDVFACGYTVGATGEDLWVRR